MKNFLAIACIVAGSAIAGGAQADPPSYPMLCHGGPGMKIMVNHDVDSHGIPGATAMFVYFDKAAQAGSVDRPHRGECTWMDRTINAGEPAVMWIKSPNIEFAFQVMGNGRVVTDTTGPRLNVEGTSWSAEARDWDKIVKAVLTGGMFTVQVYNSGGSSAVMVITHVDP